MADLNKAVKLFPDFAYAYYNRANLLAPFSGSLPEAFEDYTKAISHSTPHSPRPTTTAASSSCL